ncbi:hypothetical protein BDR06DRAFT_1005321 [Suillus hirtellus]|nr:hypothetical protein BDR06DRAFT_1005321 [Suillus hirtellus]
MQGPPWNSTGSSKSSKSSKTTKVKATAEPVMNSHDSSDGMVINVDDSKDEKAPKRPGVKAKNVRKAVIWKLMAQVAGSCQLCSAVEISEETHSEQVASQFEDKEDSKKTAKTWKAIPKAKCSIKDGKSKSESLGLESQVADKDKIMDASATVESKSYGTIVVKRTRKKAGGRMTIESEDDVKEADETGTIGEEEHRLTTENIDSVVLQQELPYDLEMLQSSEDEMDEIILPPGIEHWEARNKAACVHGNSQILLKLGAWMLVRFRQLAKIPMANEVQGLFILESP